MGCIVGVMLRGTQETKPQKGLSPVVIRNSVLRYCARCFMKGSSSFSDRLRDTVPGRVCSSLRTHTRIPSVHVHAPGACASHLRTACIACC